MADDPLTASRFEMRRGLIVETVDGEALVLDPKRDLYFGLDAVGLFLWEQIKSGMSGPGLLDALVSRYPDVGSSRLSADARSFLKSVVEAGLVRACAD